MTTDRTTAPSALLFLPPMSPEDYDRVREWAQSLLDRLERAEAVVEAAELVLSLDASFRPNGVTRYPQLARAVTTYLAVLDSAASDD